MWGELDFDIWETAGAPPQFSVSATKVVRDWTLFWTGYQYSVRDAGEQGQYHLILVNPLVIVLVCAAMIVLAFRRAEIAIRTHRRAREGHCLQCGYDLRAGHERCPECGTAVQLPFVADAAKVAAHAEPH